MNPQHEKARAWLTLKLRELGEGLENNLEELQSDKHHLADLEELASDVNADGVVFEQFKSSSDTAQQIERALERIENGSYETCEECNCEIGSERLEALPFATECVECRRMRENASG